MFRSKQKLMLTLGFLMLLAVPMGACKDKPPELPKIDLQQVGEAFERSNGATATSFLWDFEWRVNQIYAGKEFVRISARRVNNKLRVVGYIDKNKVAGYQLADDLIFQLREFKGAFKFGYKVYDHVGWAGYERKYNTPPTFGFYGLLIMRPFGYYYTPRTRLVIYRRNRIAYRKSAGYRSRRARASKFRSSAKKAGSARSRARRSSRRGGGKR